MRTSIASRRPLKLFTWLGVPSLDLVFVSFFCSSKVWQCWLMLIRLRLERCETSPEETEHTAAETSCYSRLASMIHRHHTLPSALGLGETSASQKLRALMLSLWFESASYQDLEHFLPSVTSWTTDMGVESGFTSFKALYKTDPQSSDPNH